MNGSVSGSGRGLHESGVSRSESGVGKEVGNVFCPFHLARSACVCTVYVRISFLIKKITNLKTQNINKIYFSKINFEGYY